jgi:hypothetical protein
MKYCRNIIKHSRKNSDQEVEAVSGGAKVGVDIVQPESKGGGMNAHRSR